MKTDRDPAIQEPTNKVNWTTIGLVAGLVLLIAVIAFFTMRGNSDQDKLTNVTAVEGNAVSPSPEKLCASKATYDLIKHELFRRAAQLRGSDQAAFDRLSSYAVVRMENPVMESEDSSTGAVHCSATLSLDLPPGVATSGGQRTLTSDIDYNVQQAADGTGPVVLLQNADAVITPLATLAKAAEVAEEPSQPAPIPGPAPGAEGQPAVPAPPPPASPAPPAPSKSTSPAFSCATAHSQGEKLVCGDPGLAALDRSMALEYGRAAAVATEDQRNLLRQTASRFNAYRDRCPDRQCIAAAYAARVREIRDIVEGRWQPPR